MTPSTMKSLRLLGLAAVAAALMLSCAREPSRPEVPVEETPGLELSFNAYPGDEPGTRTQRDETGHITWSPQEQVSIYSLEDTEK